MLKKMSFTLTALVAVLLTLSSTAFAKQEIMAEEAEAYLKKASSSNQNRVSFFTQDIGLGITQNGTIVVTGEPSEFQIFNRVKAVKCAPTVSGSTLVANRKSCSEASYFNLNEVTSLAPGFYILGFENSIYPGFVKINANQQTEIALQKISISSEGSTKVFRNLNSAIEQKKLFFTQFQLGKAMFSLANYDFGDLYLRKFPMEDIMPNVEYSFCDSGFAGEQDPQAKGLCAALKSKTFMGMKPFFVFNADSTHTQYVPRNPGDAFPYYFERLLVGAPTSGPGAFVNVFPGDYTIEILMNGKTTKSNVSLKAEPNFGLE